MVYNGTSSGLNTSLWFLHFVLPTALSTIQDVETGTFMADWYIGEMFLNFMLSEEFIPFCVVNGKNFRTEEWWENGGSVGWQRW